MRASVRRAIGILTALVLTSTGLVVGAAPAGAGVGTVTGSNGDIEVTARVQVPDGGRSMAVWLDHNGTSVELTSARIRVMDPRDGQIYARETSFEYAGGGMWTATDFHLPRPLDLGRYLVSFDTWVGVQTEDGGVEVRVGGTDILDFFVRMSPVIRDVQVTPQSVPEGEKVVVSGIALRSSAGAPLAGEPVQVWFDPEGAAPAISHGSAVVDARGYFQKTLTASSGGTWRVEIPESDESVGARSAEVVQETRSVDRPTHSGSATRTVKGYQGGVRLATTDVVVGLEPVDVRIDAGIVGFGWARSRSGVEVESRRAEGGYRNGVQLWPDLVWTGSRAHHDFQAAYTTARISPLMPAGVYDVGIRGQAVAVCTAPEPESRQQCIDDQVSIDDPTITTLTVKRVSSTYLSASSRSVDRTTWITLSGSVRKVQLVGTSRVADRRAPNSVVKLYFDPEGSQGPVYKKTVRTGSDGTYSVKALTSSPGQWIAKYPGSSLHASSQRAVSITAK
jgi:hypothetical protein